MLPPKSSRSARRKPGCKTHGDGADGQRARKARNEYSASRLSAWGAGYDTKLIRRDLSNSTLNNSWLSRICCTVFWLELDAIQRYELKAVLRADVDATTAQNHMLHLRNSSKTCSPAMQAALGFFHRRVNVVATSTSVIRCAFQRQHRMVGEPDPTVHRHCCGASALLPR